MGCALAAVRVAGQESAVWAYVVGKSPRFSNRFGANAPSLRAFVVGLAFVYLHIYTYTLRFTHIDTHAV